MAASVKSSTRTTSSRAAAPRARTERPAPPRPDDAATAYARAVVDGRVVACKWVRLACQRHLTDLETGHTRGLWWDADVVEDLRLFFLGLRHSKGEWGKAGGQPIALEPWQLFILGSLFAWKRADGTRRFRVAYTEVARKNGKSTMAAGVGLHLAFFDDEPGAEVYAAATKLEQAMAVWGEARRMVQRSPRLRERITVLTRNLHDHATASKFEPLGADEESQDGLNVHGAIVDELHAHKTREQRDVLATAMGARRQGVLFEITTAGYNRAGVCYDERTYVTKILDGVITADEVFGVIYTLDEGDDWRDPAVWIKANPNLGVSLQADELAAECARAVEIPSARTSFKTKRLNVWENAGSAEVDMLRWARAETPFTFDDVADAQCWIGVDLASKGDLAATVAVFLRGDGHVFIRSRFYLPSEMVHDAAHAATAHYAGWAAAGHLTLTEGDLIDFAVIRADLLELARRVACQEVDFDPYNATHLETELTELGLTVVEIPQTVKQLSGPMYAVRDLLKAGRLHHDGNQVMTWCASNVESREDANGNLFPRKASRNLKIDGYTALLNALARALLHMGPMASDAEALVGPARATAEAPW